MAARRALITGIGGQDGSLLAELLLAEGYDVFGVVRRVPSSYENLAAIRERIELIQADLLDQLSLVKALEECRPHEVYNLASVSFVPASWEQPVLTAEFAAVGTTPLSPLTPYGVAKAYAHFVTGSYRHRYGLHASAGILYNHESPRRPLDFVPRKVALAAAEISRGLRTEVWLGDLDAP